METMTWTPQRLSFDEAIRVADLVARRCQTRLRVFRDGRTGSWLIATADPVDPFGLIANGFASYPLPRGARHRITHVGPRGIRYGQE